MKACPFCREQIQDAAIKCRFCGSMLESALPVKPEPQPTSLLHRKVTPAMGCSILVIALLTFAGISSSGKYNNYDSTSPTKTNTDPAHSSPPKLIHYEVLSRSETSNIKVVFVLRVKLVNSRLPTQYELAEIAKHIHSKERPHERTFIQFLLPGMTSEEGAFASAIYDPNLEVFINESLIPDTYRHLIK